MDECNDNERLVSGIIFITDLTTNTDNTHLDTHDLGGFCLLGFFNGKEDESRGEEDGRRSGDEFYFSHKYI